MKKITIFSKIAVLFLFLTSLNACKKSETVAAAATGCKISKVDYGDGTADNFIYNNADQVAEYYYEYKDATGKTARTPSSVYTYDANGSVTIAKYGNGSGQEKYTYASGALSTIEIFDGKNASVYKITVTTDANKRVIGMKDAYNYSSKITRDAQGNFLKNESYDDKNNLITKVEASTYDGKKSWRSAFTGWSVDLTQSYNDYISYGAYFNEPSGNASDYKYYSALDDNGKYTGKLVLTNSITPTWQYNSQGFPSKGVFKDIVDASNNSTRTYSYSNCQ